MTDQPTSRLRYPLDEGIALIGLNRTRAYALIRTGELRTQLDGKRRYISHQALTEYVERLDQQEKAA